LKYLIEIATTDFITVQAAVAGGADRVELCSALSEGGLTPSHGLIKRCREKFKVTIFPIIRPRGGDFLYTEDEFEIMKSDVLWCKEIGCDGVVVGFLNEDGSIDKKKTSRIVQLAYPMEVTFHRAFDRCVDPLNALEDIIEVGCQRILTSGQQQKAFDGAALIKEMIAKADNRIIIMPGSGVRPDNIKALEEATGAVEFHASLRSTIKSKMQYVHPSFADTDDYDNNFINADEVKALRKGLETK
jgi:copper homeostasis protein